MLPRHIRIEIEIAMAGGLAGFMRKGILLRISATLMLGLAVLGASTEPVKEPLKVAVTHPFVQEWVESIGGDEVSVTLVSADEKAGLDGAALVYVCGLGQEPWLDEAFADLKTKPRRVVLTEGMPVMMVGESYWQKMEPPHPNPEGLPQCCRADAVETNQAWSELVTIYSEEDGSSSSEPDPNLWYNPRNAMSAVVVINETLCDARPEAGDMFDRRMSALMEELVLLDGWIKSRIRDIPVNKRILRSDGGDFRYYAQAYGLIAPVTKADESDVVFLEASGPDALCQCESCPCASCICPSDKVLFTLKGADVDTSGGGKHSGYDSLMRQNTETVTKVLTN